MGALVRRFLLLLQHSAFVEASHEVIKARVLEHGIDVDVLETGCAFQLHIKVLELITLIIIELVLALTVIMNVLN